MFIRRSQQQTLLCCRVCAATRGYSRVCCVCTRRLTAELKAAAILLARSCGMPGVKHLATHAVAWNITQRLYTFIGPLNQSPRDSTQQCAGARLACAKPACRMHLLTSTPQCCTKKTPAGGKITTHAPGCYLPTAAAPLLPCHQGLARTPVHPVAGAHTLLPVLAPAPCHPDPRTCPS